MAHRRAVAIRTRGGPVISPARRTRLITAVAAIGALVGADTYGITARGKYELVELACAALSLLALLAALTFRRVTPAIWAVALGTGCYMAGRSGHDAVDSRSTVVGVLLLLSAECASWSADASPRLHIDWRVHAQRAAVLLVIAMCSFAADFFVLAGSGIAASGEVALAAAGSAAAVAAVALVAFATRR